MGRNLEMMDGKPRNIIFLGLLMGLFLPWEMTGQNGTIKGFVYDAGTQQPMPLVNIVVAETGLGTISSEEGYYLLDPLPEGDITLKATMIGYDTAIIRITLKRNATVIRNIYLKRASYDLGEIRVTGASEKVAQRKISEIRIMPAEIGLTPSVGGMPDLIQHIQALPGVITRGDIGGQVYIRGGTPVQTKVLLDEVVIYNPVHSIGLFSVLDNDYLRSVNFYTGGFNAEYGSCLSSVIDISSKNPNSARWTGKLDVSTIASKCLLEGPLIKDSTRENLSLSVLLSFKRSYFEQACNLFYPYLDQELPFYFQDIYGKTTVQLGKSFSISFSGYSFKDEVSETNTFKNYNWNSRGFSLNLMSMPPDVPILIKTYCAGSVYRMNLEEPNCDNRFSEVSSISVGIKFYRYRTRLNIKYGVDFTELRTNYQYYTNKYNNYEQEENSGELSGFLDFEGSFGWFLFEAGFRGAYYTSLFQFSPEPRISLRFLITENLALKAAAGIYAQNLIGAMSDKDIVNFFQGYLSAPVDMVSESGKDPNDLYLQKASHLVAGVEYDWRGRLFFDLEGYYKNYTQLINFNKNKLFNKNDEPGAPAYMTGTFISETGFAEGLELSAKFFVTRASLEVNYSLALVKRRYQDSNGETVEYFPQYDRRHNLNISGRYTFGKNRTWEATARWNYGSGFPFTPSSGYYEGISFDENGKYNFLTQNGGLNILYGSYNSKRLPAYQRLDMALRKTFSFRNRSQLDTELSVINLYDHRNIFYVNRNTNEEAYQLPVLPSLRISYDF